MSFPRYPTYKPSGVEWLGEVPAGWTVCAVRRILGGIEQGWSPDCLGRPAMPEEWGVLKAGCVNRGVYSEAENKALPDELSPVPEYEVRAGDVLMSRASGSHELVGSTALVTTTRPKLMLSDKVFRLRLDAAISPTFFVAALNSRILRAQIERAISGADGLANNLPQSALRSFLIAVPPAPEQRDIATFLDRETARIDALVAEQEQLIELLHEKRQAVISHAVTKGLDPDVPMKDSGVEWLGAVPGHWSRTRLKALFRQEKRQNFPDRPVLSVYRDYGVIYKDSRTDNINKTPEDISGYQLVQPGDLVVNKMKSWQGSLGISAVEGITSPDYAVFTPHHSAHSDFLHHLLRCQAMVTVYRGISNGIRLDQWRLEPDVFLGLPVFLPPPAEQAAIVGRLGSLAEEYETLITEATHAITLLQERRSALITAAVTGQIDVRGVA